jgi:hypothetical protein
MIKTKSHFYKHLAVEKQTTLRQKKMLIKVTKNTCNKKKIKLLDKKNWKKQYGN